jgi:diguanylate cyclase (GGDEF)-like protein
MSRLFIRRRLARVIGQTSTILGVAMIAMLWFGIVWKYQDHSETEHRAAVQNNANLALLFEENVVRTIGEVDKALLYVRRRIQERDGTVDFRRAVSNPEVMSDTIRWIAIIDATGTLRAANNAAQPPPPADLSDREHFRIHLGNTKDELFVGRPIVGRVSGKWLIPLSRRFYNKDGSFAGVLVASLDPGHFTQFYQSIKLGRSGSFALFGLDGGVRATGGTGGRGLFQLAQDISGTRLHDATNQRQAGTFVEPAKGADGSRLVTFRQIRGLPLAVSISVTEAQVYAGSHTDLIRHALVGFCLTLVILAIGARGTRDQLRLRLATAKMLRSQRRALQKSEQLRLTLDNMGQGILLVTKHGRIPVINQQAVRLLDLPDAFLRSAPSYDELTACQKARGELADVPEGVAAPEASVSRDADGAYPVHERTRPDGTVLEIRSTALPDGGFVRTFTDITRRRQAQEAVAKIASHDALTGLGNRRLLKEQLEKRAAVRSSADASRDFEEQGFALLCLDLDLFKVVNDTLGHWIGDALLKAVADRLIATVRTGHVVVRLGGDEFAVLMPRAQSTEQPEALARRLLEVLSHPYDIHGQQLQVGASIGIALAPHDGTDPDLLLKAGDMALYAAKAAGRGTYRFFHKSMADRLRAKRQLEIDLRSAIDNDELELHYQPLLNIADTTITGFEALMRWQHPLRGMVPPGEFIPIAEETGLIVPLGAWAIRKACEQAAKWPDPLYVAVNVSPTQFRGGNLVATVAEVLSSTGLAPSRLELEITETILMQENDPTIHALHQLRDTGVRIAMDDFGTGYSSLSYLRSFPLSKIKIDRAFVKDLRATAASDVIIRSVIDIAKTLEMTTTAEGVETREQFEMLGALGCSEAQGYYLSKAVPVSQVPGLIAKWSAKGASIAA